MKKKTISIITIIMICIVVVTTTSCKLKHNVVENFPTAVSKLNSYKLTGRLESNFPTGEKVCNITTYYKAPNMYRVEIENNNTLESQIMIKNETGVYVIIPSVNKTFKVNTSWPTNSSYPYLLQSISSDIVKDNNIIETKTEFGKTLDLKAKLFSSDENTTQRITFNDKNRPTEIVIFDEAKNPISRFIIKSIEENLELDNSLFLQNETLNTMAEFFSNNPLVFDRMIKYPTYNPFNTKVKEESIKGIISQRVIVITFSGDTDYTIVEQYVNRQDEAVTKYVNGDIYVMGDNFTFVDDNNISFYNEGVEYIVASNKVGILEMIKIGESLKTTSDK